MPARASSATAFRRPTSEPSPQRPTRPPSVAGSTMSAGGVLRNMEAMTAQMQAARVGGASTTSSLAGAGAAQSGGVWISQELWRAIRRQLESKVQEFNALVEEHQRVKADLTESLNKAHMRNAALEGLSKDLELAVKDSTCNHEKQMGQLGAEMDATNAAMCEQQRECNRMSDQMMGLMKERDFLKQQVENLNKKAADLTHQLNLEGHRHAMSSGKIAALEKEHNFLQDKAADDSQRVQELENKNRLAATQITELHMQVESLKEEMLVMRRPDELVQDEMSRVQADNRRLVHMLERTAEFKRLMDDMSELKDVHYIPLNECLVEEDLISYPYLPERDREVVLSKESYHWVPKEAFELVQTFLERLFPRVPVQPFMMLLLQLNKVWKDHEAKRLAEVKAKHTTEVARLKRKLNHQEPYHEVWQKTKIVELQRQLAVSKKMGQKLERYKELARKAGNDTESKLLLDWGLATIEKLSKQVSDSVQENRVLRKRLGGLIEAGGLADDAPSAQAQLAEMEARDLMQYGSPSKYITGVNFSPSSTGVVAGVSSSVSSTPRSVTSASLVRPPPSSASPLADGVGGLY